ncbi:helix-turn-helix domain-containing protein [Streptomyces sp. RB6PN25]|uniref:Helix-turn-helix domain-containing protein n=1 Tax=Streptomyces humicola TaxID=2953240 RepID=A0ABT1PU49_9ACTN|nr:GAF domain-containing protein [Streptomyces humicola]MCQ4080047.1 helix-turn-helix domain-containing protein [Streptomyces humicola]
MPEPHRPVAPSMRRLVELLAEGAPPEAFDEVVAGARSCGTGKDDLRELEVAAATALRVRRTLRQHRRRENELTALFDTAGDLASLRDLGAVLPSIVRRARMLLGTDTAYLTLPDEDAGDTYMRVTDGSASALFQSLRLGLGEGLGGLVAQTTRPYATPDYLSDERFHHTPTIDSGVREEGLVAILGVPLLLGSSSGDGGKVIGVLFAADRRPRTFSPDEVTLLCSLADHAAIAIDTARALAANRAALADLAEANSLIREHSAAMQRAEQAHDRLTDLVLRGGDVREVAAALAGLLGGAICVHDPLGRRLTAVDHAGRTLAEDTACAVADTRPDTTGRTVLAGATADSRTTARAIFRDGRWVCAVLAGQELLGSLVLHGRAHLDDPDRRLFERAAVVTALLLMLRRSVAETENRVRGELLTDLLSAPHRDPAGLTERGRRVGVDLDRPHLLLAAESEPESRGKLAAAAAQHLFGTGGISAEHGEHVVMLLPDDSAPAGETARGAAAQLSHLAGAPVTVAGAGPGTGPSALAEAYTEAVRCLAALRILGRTGDGAAACDLGFLGVLLGGGHDVGGFIAATLGPLLEYDARRGTELVRTLEAYFACGGSLTRAKERLHIHVNTVVQRLDRIQAMLGHDWNTPDRALELQLALRLRTLAGEAPAGGARPP